MSKTEDTIPTEPTDPTEPVESTEPVEPTESAEPLESVESTESVEPAESDESTESAETTEPATPNTDHMRWYVIRTYSGHENKVKQYLDSEIAQSGLDDRIGAIVVPSEKVLEVRDGKKRTRTKNSFPGYVLIQCVLDRDSKHLVLNTPSVIAFLGTKDVPTPIRDEEANKILGRMEEMKDVEVPDVQFKIGDAVRVMDGPFNTFSGFVQEVNHEKAKLKVMVSIFGRKTPIELDFNQVEFDT